jgi:WD40 repeat protein
VHTLDAQNPWPGLEQFREEDAALFRGRDAEAEELLRLVRRDRLTVLFGLSGLGKSSLLQAGLFPALRADGQLPVYVRVAYDERAPAPRTQVLAALAHAAARDEVEAPGTDDDATLWEHFHRRGAAYWTADNQPATPVLVLDQFEEAFTLARQTPERASMASAFLDELADLVVGRVPAALRARLDAEPATARQFDFSRHAYKVLIAIREDFLADLEMLRGRMPSLAGNRTRLVALRGDAALVVTQAGGDSLVPRAVGERIVRLVGSEHSHTGAAEHELGDVIVDPALLSLFCRELNERRKTLGHPAITTELVEGTRESILGDFYERSVADLGPGVRRLVEDRLITEVGGYRDSVALENALAMPGVSSAAVESLVERRLVRREERDGRTRLELTHDVLTEIVRRSRDLRRNEQELERARADADRQRLELARARRAVKRARVVTATMALLVLAAAAAGFVAWRQGVAARRSAAEANRALATSEFLQAARLTGPADLPEALARLAESMRRMPESDATRSLAFALLERIPAPIATFVADTEARTAVFSRDGARIVVAGDSSARVLDVATGRQIGPAMRHADIVWSAAFSPDGRRVVTASSDRTAQVWDAATGRPIGPAMLHPGMATSAAFSPDGSRILTICQTVARVWDAATGRELLQLRYEGTTWVRSATFSPDGQRILTSADDNTLSVWDASTGRRVGTPIHVDQIPVSTAFSPDGRRVVIGSRRAAMVYDLSTGQEIQPRLEHGDWVTSVAFSPDGRRILTGSDDNTAQLWDAATHRPLLPVLWHRSRVSSVAFSPDGRRIATTSGSIVQLWDAPSRTDRAQILTLLDVVRSARFSPDGRRILTGGAGQARLWDVATGREIRPGLIGAVGVVRAAFSVDGRRIVTAGDSLAQVLDVATGREIGPALRGVELWSATLSSDEARIVTTAGSTAQVWDVATGERIGLPMRHHTTVNDAEFSPDGRRVVTASADRTAQIWDPVTGQRVGPALAHQDAVWSAAFSPDGARIVTASKDSTAQLWNAATGTRLGPAMRHADAVYRAVFSPDGRRIVTASDDSSAQLWDAATSARIGWMRHDGTVFDAAFSPDGQRIVTADESGAVRLWDARTATAGDAATLAALADAVARRRLSPTGAIHAIAPESASATLDALRRRAREPASAASGSFLEFLRWYFARPDERPPFAGAPEWTSTAPLTGRPRATPLQR